MDRIVFRFQKYFFKILFVVLVATVAVGCADTTDTADVKNYSVGGTVSGLTHSGLVLQNNSADDLAIFLDGSFTFKTSVNNTSTYNVTVLMQPGIPSQTFTVSGGVGSVSGADVVDIAVTCTDDIAPVASIVLPTNNSTNVDRSKWVNAFFSEDMFASSIDTSSFTLSNSRGENVAGEMNFDVLQNIASLKPDHELNLQTTYTARLSNSITDLSGNALDALNWSFTTVDGTWGTPENINNNDSTNTHISINDSGEAIAVWSTQEAVGILDGVITWNDYVWSSRYIVDNGWGEVELIQGHVVDTVFPKVIIDDSGNAMSIWVSEGNIWGSHYTAGSGWSVAEIIQSDTAIVTDPQISMDVDSNGNVLLAWISRGDVWSRRYSVVDGWGAAGVVENISDAATALQIAYDTNGNAIVV